jgi:ribonucleoside-diphosphate reductase alpha chain
MVAVQNTWHVQGRYMTRERVPDRRHTWRQKATIVDAASGRREVFYVEFGEYDDGRLAELWITSHKCGDSFTRGTMDTLAKSLSLALQCGTSPHDMAKTLRGQNYPPSGRVDAPNSSVTSCTSLADYIAQEIVACYDKDGRFIHRVPSNGALVNVPDAPVGK